MEFLKYDLQFFAEEGESENTQEVAEPVEETTENVEETTDSAEEEAAEPQQQSEEMNRVYADMRRRAEAEAQRKFEAKQRELDAQFAKTFGKFSNPKTNAPIKSAADYIAAFTAQERAQADEQLKSAGVDPSLIDRAIANSPELAEARQATEMFKNMQAQQMIQNDFAEVLRLDPSLKSASDITSQPNYMEVIGYCQNHPGTSFADAYKLVNFDRLASSKTAAAQQAAINQAKSKTHLTTPSGVAPSSEKEIPQSEIGRWKAMFPDKSGKELRSLYNKIKK